MRHAIYLAAFLCACGSQPVVPLEQQYQRQPWAKMSVQQAEAECHAEINRIGGTPNMYLCMKARGWFER
jgi:hypothetical protein